MPELGTIIGLISGKTKALSSAIAQIQEDIPGAVADWLDDHPEATTTVQDGAISRAKLDGDLSAKLDDATITKTGVETFAGYGTFVNGTLQSGVLNTGVKYRVATNTIMSFDRDITITIADGFRLAYHTFVNGSFSQDSGWLTGSKTIVSGTNFKIIIARASDDSSEVADVPTFLSKLTFKTVTQKNIEKLTSDVTALDGKIDDKTGFVEYITDADFEDTTNVASGATWQEGYYRGTNGNASTSQYTTNYICSDFIAVVPGFKYRLYVSGTCGIVLEQYPSSKNSGTETSLGTVNAGNYVDITIADGKEYIALNCSMNHSNKVNVIHRLTQYESEKQICFPKLAYGTQKWIGKKIVNFGDSIFANGVGTGKDITSFLQKECGATVVNCAFGGCRMGIHTAEQFDAFSMYKIADAISTGTWTTQDSALSGQDIPSYFSTTLAALKAIDFSEVDVVTISYGTNDFAGGLRIGGSDNYSTDYALKYSIEKILTAYPNLRIFVCVPMYRVWLDESYEFDEDSNTKEVTSWVGGGSTYKLTDFVQAERDVCKETQIPVLDLYYDLGINKWNWGTYFPSTDGTHPNETGRKLIAEYIAAKIW